MYEKVSANLNFVEREKKIEAFWRENKIFEKSIEDRRDCKNYTFYDGPPTANGKPHIGHVLTRVIKDMIPRYRTMKGYKVDRKAGWDTHGLPVELEVEKKLGLDGKEQIEQYGIAPFIAECKESVWKYKGMWEKFSGTVGFWADMEHPYVTYENDYIESEWWALKQIYDKGLLYKGFQIVPYCPRCGTPLATHEVAQGYKTVKERSAVVRFKAKGEDAYFLAWTTTPWTLPSNVALTVNPDEVYCKVKAADGYTYYMAKALLDTVLGRLAKDGAPAYEILESMTGKELEYREYEPLFACTGEFVAKTGKKAHFLTCANYVTMTDGTGIVHTAPAFGADDLKTGRRYDLPFVQFVDGKGDMTENTPYAGKFVKEADPLILHDLKEEGLLFDAPNFEHEYPFCWRCDTPLIYYARDSWFIEMTKVRENLIQNNNTINWIPESIGKGRFGDWLENVQDWGISRNRYWGTPLNIWECECGHRHAVGSIAELREMSDSCPEDIELHRPFIDAVTIKCPHCGGEMHRVKEVIDCWFDSGSMPFAQHHYPFENRELFESQFPADFISEAVDQTRGWFYSLLAISTLIFDKAPYKNVIVLGLVQDENGQKMSKSKGEFLTVSLLEQKQRIESLYGESRSTIAPVHFSVSTQRYPFTEDAFLEMLQQNQENRYQYTLKETSMDGVIDDVYDHRADIGVIFLTKLTEKIVCRLLDGRELTFHELAAVPPCVYVRKGHPLTQLEHVSEADLEGYPYSSFEQAQGVAVDFSEELPMVSMRKPSKAIIVNNRSTAMNVLANTDAYSTGSGLLAEHLSPANVVTIPLADKDPVRLGWIYPQNAKLSSHAEEFVRLLEQSIQRSIAYTSSLHRQIVGK